MSEKPFSVRDLEPCPFCRSPAWMMRGSYWATYSFFVKCSSPTCFCRLGERYSSDHCLGTGGETNENHRFKSEDEARAAWNRRPS